MFLLGAWVRRYANLGYAVCMQAYAEWEVAYTEARVKKKPMRTHMQVVVKRTCRSQPLASSCIPATTIFHPPKNQHTPMRRAYITLLALFCRSLLSKCHYVPKKTFLNQVYSWVYRHDWHDVQAPRSGCLLGWFPALCPPHYDILPTKNISQLTSP